MAKTKSGKRQAAGVSGPGFWRPRPLPQQHQRPTAPRGCHRRTLDQKVFDPWPEHPPDQSVKEGQAAKAVRPERAEVWPAGWETQTGVHS